MRVVISAPRKSGGAQLRCLISMAYELKAPPVSAPEQVSPDAIVAWLKNLPDQCVSTCDLPSAELVVPAESCGVHLVGVIRHPFDLFLSNFDVVQQRATRGHEDSELDHTWSVLSGEDLGGAVTQEYAVTGFASEVKSLRDWAASGKSIRFEELHEDPAEIFSSLSDMLGPLTEEQVNRAVGLCPAENVVVSRPGRGRRMPSLSPGAWRDRLPETLLETLRKRYRDDVTALGYDVS